MFSTGIRKVEKQFVQYKLLYAYLRSPSLHNVVFFLSDGMFRFTPLRGKLHLIHIVVSAGILIFPSKCKMGILQYLYAY